jgi:voltage-gated potassium channel
MTGSERMSEGKSRAKHTVTESGARKKLRGHMGLFFFSLLALILLTPLLRSDLPGQVVITVAFVAILISGVYAVSDTSRHRIIAVALGIPLIVGYVIAEFVETKADAAPIGITLGVPFFLFVTYRLLMFVVRASTVSKDELFASASVYVMFGFTWAGLYGLLEFFQPGSFSHVGVETAAVWDTLFYFSFVTLTTLGYGDIVPITEFARHLAILEALTGVLSLSFLVARIVSLYRREE